MGRLTRTEMNRVAEIQARLATVQIGERSAVADVMPALRELLDADNAIFYSLREGDDGWRLDRWHDAGEVGHVRDLLDTAVASSNRSILFYDPRAPVAWMRNRVIEVTQRIERVQGPGSWLDWSVCKSVFRPARMEGHKHLRALLCHGSDLLGWLGTLVPDMPERHHFELLSALVPAFQRRVLLERRLADAPRSSSALDAALESVGAPAFIVDGRGVIRAPNAAARVLIDGRRAEVAEAIAAAHVGRAHPLRIDLTPVAANGMPAAWLAIVRVGSADSSVAVARAAQRWALTPRQRAVLAGLVDGESTATIAASLDISARAVELHITALLQRADVGNRAALVAQVLMP